MGSDKRGRPNQLQGNLESNQHDVMPPRANPAHPPIGEITKFEVTSGPIPHPDILAKYESIQPGLVERIVSMAEREAAHRHDREISGQNSDIECKRGLMRERARGQWCAFFIVVLAIAGACYMVQMGQPGPASALVGVTLAGIVAAFIYGRKSSGK